MLLTECGLATSQISRFDRFGADVVERQGDQLVQFTNRGRRRRLVGRFAEFLDRVPQHQFIIPLWLVLIGRSGGWQRWRGRGGGACRCFVVVFFLRLLGGVGLQTFECRAGIQSQPLHRILRCSHLLIAIHNPLSLAVVLFRGDMLGNLLDQCFGIGTCDRFVIDQKTVGMIDTLIDQQSGEGQVLRVGLPRLLQHDTEGLLGEPQPVFLFAEVFCGVAAGDRFVGGLSCERQRHGAHHCGVLGSGPQVEDLPFDFVGITNTVLQQAGDQLALQRFDLFARRFGFAERRQGIS